MMELINFVNMGTDDRILKSLPTEDCPEELVKAMNKAGLVQKEVTVQGANGKTFTRKQWVRASDVTSSSQQGGPNLPKSSVTPTLPDGVTMGTDGSLSWDKSKLDGGDILDELCGDKGFDTLVNKTHPKAQSKILGKHPNFDYSSGEESIDSLKISGNTLVVTSTITQEGYDDDTGGYETYSEQFVTKIPLKRQSSKASKTPATPTGADNSSSKASISFDLPAHGDSKKAMTELLASGKSREAIMDAAKSAGITWTHNDHAGINWMRASMAIQKHMKAQSQQPSTPTPAPKPQQSTQSNLPKGIKVGKNGTLDLSDYEYGEQEAYEELTGEDMLEAIHRGQAELEKDGTLSDDFDVESFDVGDITLKIEGGTLVTTFQMNFEGYDNHYDQHDYVSGKCTVKTPLKR